MGRAFLPLPFLALAWLGGVAAAAFTDADAAALIAASSLLAAVSIAVWPRPQTLLFGAAGVALVFAAGLRYQATEPDPDPPLAALNDAGDVRLRGVVSDEPDERAATTLYRLDVREVQEGGRWRPESGRVLITGPLYPVYEYGDLLEIEGELETPPTFPDFDYRDYLLRRGIASIVSYPEIRLVDTGQGAGWRSVVIDVRRHLSQALSDVLPQPQGSLAAGILFGSRAAVPADLRADMNATGTSHLVAVSGQNVAIVAALMIAALAWVIGRRPAAFIALGAIAAYVLLVGAQPSVLRAAAMGGIYVVAVIGGRQNTAWVALLLAAALMTMHDPQIVHDAAFQLSFAATLGLTTLAGPLRERAYAALAGYPSAWHFPLTRPLLEMMIVTLTAIAFTLPITAVSFHRLSIVAPLANLFAVPAFLAVAITSGVAAIVGLLVPGDADVLAWLAWPPAAYMTWVISFFAGIPAASIELRGINVWHATAWYAALLAGTWWLMDRRVLDADAPDLPPLPSRRPLVPVAGVLALVVLAVFTVWLVLDREENGRLSVTFLDVGQGDAILIEGPQGHRVLVDGGPSGQAITNALSRALPFEDRRLDLVVLTHPDADHEGGLLEVLNGYDVRAVLNAPSEADTALHAGWLGAVTAANVPVTDADRGQTIDLGSGARIDVLSPDADDSLLPVTEDNDASVIFRLSMGAASFLLTGDLTEDGELALIRSGSDIRSTVLKVAHHGSRTSTSELFLARVNPAIDVISVGADNRFGHPAEDVLDRLAGDLVLRTDERGDVTVTTDGERLWVETRR